MAFSIQKNNLHIEIFNASECHMVSIDSWDKLSTKAVYPNPFFERWNLSAALEFLNQGQTIYLVTLTRYDVLICLFPVVIKRFVFGVCYLDIWKHNHCFLSDPLMSEVISLPDVLNIVGRQLNTHWCRIGLHTPGIINTQTKYKIFFKQFSRPSIDNVEEIISHFDSMKGKVKRENKRVFKKLENNFRVEYEDHSHLDMGIKKFCEIEHNGWKGRAKGSILSSAMTIQYYAHIMANPLSKDHVSFQELKANGQTIAITIRYKTQERIYEVKTTFDEMFRHYYPGKILEIENLKHLKNISFKLVDSCTEENMMINKLWPAKLTLQTTHLFYTNFSSKLFSMVYRLKLMIKKVLE